MNDLWEGLGKQPTATFGVTRATDGEVVGPMQPRDVQYGATSTYNGKNVLRQTRHLVNMNFNKYRPDLPPWQSVAEFFLASEDAHALFIDVEPHDVLISGNLKTVQLVADAVREGESDGAIISTEDVVRDGAQRSSQDHKVTEVLE